MRTRATSEPRGHVSSRELRPERHRERVLAAIENRELPVTLSELADAVLDETGPMDSPTIRDDAESVRTRLHHVDLPKLADRGAIEYDAASNVVSASFEQDSE